MTRRPWTFTTTGRGWTVLPERCSPRPSDRFYLTREAAEDEVARRNFAADFAMRQRVTDHVATAARMADPVAARAKLLDVARLIAEGFLDPPCSARVRREASLELYAAARLYLRPPEPEFV